MKKVLIAYSTWAGATHEVANVIGKVFQTNFINVDVIKAKKSLSILTYDAFLLGTSIHAGQPVKSFRKFIKQNINILIKKPTALFVVCANMMNDSEVSREETLAWIDRVIGKYEKFKPISIGLFGGAVLTSGDDFNKLNVLIRKTIISMNKKMVADHGKSDFRDWESIQSWSEGVIKIINNKT
jgi:menaquinone-dependent protoporphyrinogen oxidase